MSDNIELIKIGFKEIGDLLYYKKYRYFGITVSLVSGVDLSYKTEQTTSTLIYNISLDRVKVLDLIFTNDPPTLIKRNKWQFDVFTFVRRYFVEMQVPQILDCVYESMWSGKGKIYKFASYNDYCLLSCWPSDSSIVVLFDFRVPFQESEFLLLMLLLDKD